MSSRLIGRQLELHLYHDKILGYLGTQLVVELPRIRVTQTDKRRGRCINYRHVIEGLRRKPRAFIYCTWQQELLPNPAFRERWLELTAQFDLDTAAVLMVEALYIAATQDQEAAVADYLERELTAQTLNLKQLQQHFRQDCPESFPQLTVTQHDLSSYDQLIDANTSDHRSEFGSPDHNSPESPPAPNSPPQAAPTDSHARPLGVPGTPGYAADAIALRSPQRALHQAGATVLCEIRRC